MGRSYEAGQKMGEAIVEFIHLFYQNDTAKRCFTGLLGVLKREMERRGMKWEEV